MLRVRYGLTRVTLLSLVRSTQLVAFASDTVSLFGGSHSDAWQPICNVTSLIYPIGGEGQS